MGHPRRRYRHGDVYLVGQRLAEGLPFVPNTFINALLYGALARAAGRNPRIIICAFEFLQNHYHLIVLNKASAKEMRDFLHDLNDELAKIVKKLLGKSNVKIWAGRPYVALLGDSGAVVKYFGYTLLNAVFANFCATADAWIGVNSYRFLLSEQTENHKWVGTKNISRLPNKPFRKTDTKRLYIRWQDTPGRSFSLKVRPFAWKNSFEDTRGLSDQEVREMILTDIKNGEEQARRLRQKNGESLASLADLAQQNPYKSHKPGNCGRRVYCICTDPELRKQLIAEYRAFCETCVAVWTAWNKGDLAQKYPPAAFIPPRMPLASAVLHFL